ncbi:MAG: glycerophosphodiester phosphodiesterase [Nitrososphaeria archaeon]|nr:glycerophosphodiester phosphodiesterase family protein [Conexivisphaerales archaeon]
MNTLLFGHRGARGLAPENTLPAFDLALQYGMDGVELDVHESADGEIIVMHDELVDRTTNGNGYIKEMTLEQIKSLDAGIKFSPKYAGTKVPTLSEVFERYREKFLYKVEIKHSYEYYPGIEEKVLETIEKFHLKKNVQIISFDFNALKRIRELDRDIDVGLIIEGRPRWFVDIAKKLEAKWIQAFQGLVYSKDDVIELHKKEVKLGLWTVNEIKDIRKFCEMEVDDLTGDYPDRLSKECRKGYYK